MENSNKNVRNKNSPVEFIFNLNGNINMQKSKYGKKKIKSNEKSKRTNIYEIESIQAKWINMRAYTLNWIYQNTIRCDTICKWKNHSHHPPLYIYKLEWIATIRIVDSVVRIFFIWTKDISTHRRYWYWYWCFYYDFPWVAQFLFRFFIHFFSFFIQLDGLCGSERVHPHRT